MCKRLQLIFLLSALLVVPQALAQDDDYVMIEDFEGEEIITMNPMANGPDESPFDFELVANPSPNDVNSSATVVRFRRSAEGDPWAGFWSVLPEPVDMTEMKYVHVHVLKPRISPIRFKVEQGTTDPPAFEIESVEPQQGTGEWEVLTFHFEDATGEYPNIVFMPDFEDPVTLEEDIEIYFDNIILSASAEPPTLVSSESPGALPQQIALRGNHPNPFHGATSIEYRLDRASDVNLRVYNALGQEVVVLVDGHQAAGTHSVSWDATSALPAGVYFYALDAGGSRQTRSMVLVR